MSNASTAISYAESYVWDHFDGNTEKARWYAAHQAYLHALEVGELAKKEGTDTALLSHVTQANMWANVAAGLRK